MSKRITHSAVRVLFFVLIALGMAFFVQRLATHYFYNKPNVVIITANALRPDHLSSYGYGHIKTPAIDNLADIGVIYKRAYTSVPDDILSYASILTGKNGGDAMAVRGDTWKLKDSAKLLSQYLGEQGYATLAVVSNSAIAEGMGFQKGFDFFENHTLRMAKEGKRADEITGPTERALEIISQYTGTKKPVFIWLEYSIPRYPYKLPKDFTQEKNSHPYDRQVLYLDAEIKKFLDGLVKTGFDKNTVIIFTSAMGENLGEHDEFIKGIFLYDSTARVPLIINHPGYLQPDKVEGPVSHVDIAPTVLGLVKADYDHSDFDGMDIVGSKAALDARQLYMESMAGYYNFAWSPVVAIVSGDYKYIELPEPELYNTAQDPYELENIAGKYEKVSEDMKKRLIDYISAKRQGIAALVGIGSDPKRKIDLVKPARIRKGSDIAYFRSILAQDPDNKNAKYVLAQLFFRSGFLKDSEALLKDLTQKFPDYNKAWEMLGMVYDSGAEFDKAAECYIKALEINPGMAVSLNNLAWYYAKKGESLQKAIDYAKKAVELAPGVSNFWDTYAEAVYKNGDKETAFKLMERAISLEIDADRIEFLKKRLAEMKAGSQVAQEK